MKPHKWAKEIKAWADGEKVYGRMDTHKSIIAEFEVTQLSQFDFDNNLFYIKPQPKDPQYLYVHRVTTNEGLKIQFWNKKTDASTYIGKIRLEVDDEAH